MIERALQAAQFRAYLSKFIVLGSTGYHSFCLLLVQSFERSDVERKRSKRIFIFVIEQSAVDDIWTGVTARVKDEGGSNFLTCDGPLILHTISAVFGVSLENALQFRVHLGGVSSSAVYLVTAPTEGTSKVSASSKTLAFKVVHNNDKFEHETKILEIVREHWTSNGRSDFYYLGNFNGKSTRLSRSIKDFDDFKGKYTALRGPAWLSRVPALQPLGGVIIMEPADRLRVHHSKVYKAQAHSELLDE
jgi:hypothetical protein